LKCGFLERFAQQTLNHNCKAVHRAYAKHAEVNVPSLADWEKDWQKCLQHNPQSKMQSMDSIGVGLAPSSKTALLPSRIFAILKSSQCLNYSGKGRGISLASLNFAARGTF
jgi:hypothetical protein